MFAFLLVLLARLILVSALRPISLYPLTNATLCHSTAITWSGGLPPFEIKLLHHTSSSPARASQTTLASLYLDRTLEWTPLLASDGWEVVVYDATRLAVGRSARFEVQEDEGWVVDEGRCRELGEEERRERARRKKSNAAAVLRGKVFHRIYVASTLLAALTLIALAIIFSVRWWTARRRDRQRLRLVSYEEVEEMDLWGTEPPDGSPRVVKWDDLPSNEEGGREERLPGYGE